MQVIQSDFVKSATRKSEWPGDPVVEIAVCGRSNVGKSTLLNALLGRRSLARVSRTPGRTRLVNFFSVTLKTPTGPREMRFADLPGYGYAEVGRDERATWQGMMEEYFVQRQQLVSVLLLCDARRVAMPKADEILFDETELAGYLRGLCRRVIPVMTKADKLSKSEAFAAARTLSKLLGERAVVCAASEHQGLDTLWRRIVSTLDSGEIGQPDSMQT